METVTGSAEETGQLAKAFAQNISTKEDEAVIVGLSGDLGSGKTSFAKGIAQACGVTQTVTSPTFVIEKIYKLKNQAFNHLIHIDAYRLENGKELMSLGWDDIVADPQNLILVEWPERVKEVLPKNITNIDFLFVDDTTRKITITHAKKSK